LGPILFSLYINDIKKLAENFEINLFADDTNLFCTAKDYNSLNIKCNQALFECKLWLNRNRLTLNTAKTHFVNFSKQSKNHNININLRIENDQISEQKDTKYLGLTIQNDLKWDKHIKNVINTLNSHIPLYYQLRDITPYCKRMMIYKALSHSIINYGIELYAKSESAWINQLQKTQNRLIKILLKKNKLTRTQKLHKENNILKVTDQAKVRTTLLSHRVIYYSKQANIAYETMRIANHSGRNLRNNLNFATNINYFLKKNKIVENASVIWNSLPYELKTIQKREAFKNRITNHFMHNYNE